MRNILLATCLILGAAAAPAHASENISLHVKVTNGSKVLVDTTLLTTPGAPAQARVGSDIRYVSSTTVYSRGKGSSPGSKKGTPVDLPPAERTYATLFDGVDITVSPEPLAEAVGSPAKVLLRTRVSLSRLNGMEHAGEGDARIDLPSVQNFRTQSNSVVAWGSPQVISYKSAGDEAADDYRIEVTPSTPKAR